MVYLYLAQHLIMSRLIIDLIVKRTQLNLNAVTNIVKLLDDGATIPFIARYRKEMTGSLNEVAIGLVKSELSHINDLIKRKESILSTIEGQGLLTKALRKKIDSCWDATVLEDLYLPFKKKIKTKATIAKENGLEPLARQIITQSIHDVKQEAKKFLNKKIKNPVDALEGARHIMAEWINENSKCRDYIRHAFANHSVIQSKLVKSKKDKAVKYEMYFDYEEHLKKIPSHRLLAIFRGEKESFLRVKLKIDEDQAQFSLSKLIVKKYHHPTTPQITEAINDCLKRLLLPSIENEFKKSSKLKADKEAIEVFAKNLKALLLAAPLGSKNTLAIDPGFRTGCKVVCLDKNGDLIHNETIFPHPPQSKSSEATHAIEFLVDKYNIEAIAIGNGTAGKETYSLVKKIKFDKALEVFFVNESGASIYSASKIARDEFPDKDITVRGAVSIGRRLMDPLAELVKIDPKSIGVGQYQHDVNQSMLKENLESTIESCVNAVGININTASQHLLTFVSGLGPVLAQNIVTYRTENGSYRSRKELLKVPRMGKKAFEQSAGFLRIKDSKNPLDNTAVHPERYSLVQKMAKDLKTKVPELIQDESLIASIKINQYVSSDVGLPTLQDIITEMKKPGLDPRGHAEAVSFSDNINDISDLHEGMILPGVVNNVTKFGAFVNIGIKESGLVHISEITNRFIKDPAEVLHVEKKVKVKVIKIEADKKRIALSIKQAE